MAYDHLLERKRNELLAVLGISDPTWSTLDLWDRYLTATGFPPPGAMLDRMAKAAAAAGQTLIQYIYGAGGLGPELAPVVGVDTGAYVLTGTGAPTHDGTGIHFVGSSGLSAATFSSEGLFPNDVMWRIQFTLANYSGGTFRIFVYGDTANHAASSSGGGCPGTSNGQCTAFRATSFSGSNADEIRIQCATGLCTGDITQVSVRRVL